MGALIENPPFMVKKAKWAQNLLIESPYDLLLGLQVMVLPPIVYESAINLEKRGKISDRIGTVLLTQLFKIMIFLPCFVIVASVFGLELKNTHFMFLLALIVLLNDYSGTIDPHIAFKLSSENSLTYLGSIGIFSNSILIFILFNMMPDTKSSSQEAMP